MQKITILKEKLKKSIIDFIAHISVLILLFLLLRITETINVGIQYGWKSITAKAIGIGCVKDIVFIIITACIIYIPYALLYIYRKQLANIFFIILSTIACIIQAALMQYFLTTLVPLGGDVWNYSWADIQQTVGAAGGVKTSAIILFIVLITIAIASFIFLPKKLKPTFFVATIILAAITVTTLTSFSTKIQRWSIQPEFINNFTTNKSFFFYQKSWIHFFPEQTETDIDIYADSYIDDYGNNNTNNALAFKYIDEQQYPFLHTEETPDVLSPFFQTTTTKPNIVIILVEGLGRAFTNKGAYLGNFTPFLDSLSEHSLYWQNFLSEGGRTFAVLPSLLGSLPFGKNGFNEWGTSMPNHLSLISLLRHNGYQSSFYYGGDAHFDNMDIFLQKNNINTIFDEKTFPATYTKMPANNGFTWGYGDKELFRRYIETLGNDTTQHKPPYCNVLLTVSTHSPFLINDQATYLQKVENHFTKLGFDEEKKKESRNYTYQYASILFTDDALRNFFEAYSKRSDYNNTVFMITGDHRMPEIPMSTKIDRYHVPLIIFSPLLKRTANFASISTHFDITPSVLAWLKNQYNIAIPTIASWLGNGLDTNRMFRNVHNYPFMQTKNDINDFVLGDYMINGNDLFKINTNMDLFGEEDKEKNNQLQSAFDNFKQRNQKIIQGAKLIPDSVYRQY
ncbi:MAG TPA: LTA synthase family protein, partial [Chitinophagaceae bacterium]|nr:LTA synthase family protein [Chitinophagaceae bacterium]